LAEVASAVIADVFGFDMAPDAAAIHCGCRGLAERFRRLDARLGAGPSRFRLVNAAFAPLLRLFDTFDDIADFGVFAGLRAVRVIPSGVGRTTLGSPGCGA